MKLFTMSPEKLYMYSCIYMEHPTLTPLLWTHINMTCNLSETLSTSVSPHSGQLHTFYVQLISTSCRGPTFIKHAAGLSEVS